MYRTLGLPLALVAVSLAGVAVGNTPRAQAAGPVTTFEVTYDPAVTPGPITARVYVMLGPAQGPGSAAEPRVGPNWFRPQPFFAVDAKGWKAGEPLKVGAEAVGYPATLAELPAGEYRAQAVIRLNPDTHKLGDGEGNAYGPVAAVTVNPQAGGTFALKVDRKAPKAPFAETDRVKLVELESPLLSAFYRRPVRHRAAVILPEGDLSKKRGTLYIIPGFGGDHTSAARMLKDPRVAFGKDLVRVVLDPDCGTGHHVFADSATNGPRGRALVEEFVPHIEAKFPVLADPRARLLNGHSSGGWSSLWLQVTYPETFGGTWSTSPDPVDFRDFQQINLYAPGENMFRDRQGNRRPIARMGTRAVLFYDTFSKMEDVIGEGGQLHSFEAVFSPLGSGGQPKPLWDRATGAIDLGVAKAWEAYDIRLKLERDWPTLGPRLKGKLRVIMGDMDTFYLEGATRLLKESLAKLGSDAVVEIVPGRDHMTILDAALAARLDREMNEVVRAVATP